MRIAVVTTSYPSHEGDPSGHFVESEVAELRAMGHAVHVLRPSAGGAFGWPGVAVRLKERPLRAFEAGAWIARASAELRLARPDRVIAHWAVPCAFPIALGAGPQLEVVSHGGDVRLLSRAPGRSGIVLRILERALRWRFVSEELRETLAASLPLELALRLRAASTIVPGALDVPDVLADARAKRSTIGPRRLYVCAGRLVASKRVDKVIDYVASSMLRDERVLVVLGDGPERAHLERLAREWPIDARFLGKTSRREALAWIGAADELVHASRAEGLSTVIREAGLLGVPVTILS
ncbi:MAG: glycosyltransferase [Labilithrix sp.]|nr:glycosyltransferase [Labilithrix sp.]MCW5811983.1 glycosyltransferase [Labilithrix sp.]